MCNVGLVYVDVLIQWFRQNAAPATGFLRNADSSSKTKLSGKLQLTLRDPGTTGQGQIHLHKLDGNDNNVAAIGEN